MIIRIVKMTFLPEKTGEFEEIFRSSGPKIREFPGCHGVELLKDLNNPSIYMTFSTWDEAESLEKYRQSRLFKDTWQKTKVLFSAPAEAWSLDKLLI
ncbi:MAG: antibiotic biosynthesis monooxygenase family protein [Bacteroidia bacterium]